MQSDFVIGCPEATVVVRHGPCNNNVNGQKDQDLPLNATSESSEDVGLDVGSCEWKTKM